MKDSARKAFFSASLCAGSLVKRMLSGANSDGAGYAQPAYTGIDQDQS
jgi:hypothetical protein